MQHQFFPFERLFETAIITISDSHVFFVKYGHLSVKNTDSPPLEVESGASAEDKVFEHEKQLRERMNRLHLKQRRGIESEGEQPIFGHGLTFFHLENWFSLHKLLKMFLRITHLQGYAKRNCYDFQLRHNRVVLPQLPQAFHGFTILHLSDLHIDLSADFSHALTEYVQDLQYDICVMTGDYRYTTRGPIDGAIAGMERLRLFLKDPVYAVLGNHDSVEMVPILEQLGIHLLLNEAVSLHRGTSELYLAGVDDPHYFRADNLEKTSTTIPEEAFAILLSHSPEIYKQSCYAGFDLMLSGHTHGGQVCLPGGWPLTVNASCPRYFCKGAWRYDKMQGYTSAGTGSSIVKARFNCPPEVTLHQLCRN